MHHEKIASTFLKNGECRVGISEKSYEKKLNTKLTILCSILNSLAAVRRENTSASNVFVFVCVFSSLPPALCTAAAFYLSGQQSGLSELAGHV